MLLTTLLTALPLLAAAGSLDDYYLQRFDAFYGKHILATGIAAVQTAPHAEPCLTPLYHGVKRDWNRLTPQTQKTLAKYLAKPALAGEKVVTSPGGHFNIHYASSGTDVPNPTDDNGNPISVSTWVSTVADVLENVYNVEVGQMGYRPPPTAAPYDVYLENLSSQGVYGFTMDDVAVTATSFSSYIEIDSSFTSSIFRNAPGGPYTPLQSLQITAAHEFHHAIQYGYNFYFDIWYGEATSTWMEDEVYEGVNQLYSYLVNYLVKPMSLDVALSGDNSEYGRWIFNRDLVERFNSPVIIRNIWEKLRTMPAPADGSDIPMLPVIDDVLKADNGNLGNDFFSFCKKLYMRNWSSHQNEISLIHPVMPVATYSNYPVNSASSPTSSITLPKYSYAYFKFLPSSAAPQNLLLKLAKTSGITVTAFKKNSSGDITEYQYDSSSGTINIPNFNYSDIAEVAFLVCNNSAMDGQTVNFNTDGSPLPTVQGSASSVVGSSGKSGCFIATAAYGSYLHPKVMLLRQFRDEYLMTNAPGRAFVALYYRLSPPLAHFIARHEVMRAMTRYAITPLVMAVEYKGATVVLVLSAVLLSLGLRFRRSRTGEL